MARLQKPRALGRDATLGIAAPASPVDRESLEAGAEALRALGFRVSWRDGVLARRGYLAGDDARRAAELMALVRDPGVDAIVCARGGYGCDRMLPLLDAGAVRAAAKPLVGYSDVTALLLWQQRRAGLTGFHGPMLDRGADLEPAALESLAAQLRGQAPRLTLRGRPRLGGSASGRLVGGSLTLVAASIGTPWEVPTRGALLMLEERGERPYRVDRMLQQLRGAGKLAGLAGVGLGDVSTCVEPDPTAPGTLDVIEEVLRPLGVPLVTDLPFGHLRGNFPWPTGARATLDGERGELRVLERGVALTP